MSYNPTSGPSAFGDFTAMDKHDTLAQNFRWNCRGRFECSSFLASDESGYTNGHCLTVDAGFTSGSKATDPQHMARVPFMREAGKEGLEDALSPLKSSSS